MLNYNRREVEITAAKAMPATVVKGRVLRCATKVSNNRASARRFVITNMNNPQHISFLKIEAVVLHQMKTKEYPPPVDK